MATAPPFGQITVTDGRRGVEKAAVGRAGLWSRASTWGLLLVLLYFALDGVSPFFNSPTALRAVATSSDGWVLGERLSKLCMFVVCMIFVAQRRQAVRRLIMQMKLVTGFPILALLLFPVSQMASRTISSGALLINLQLHLLQHIVQMQIFLSIDAREVCQFGIKCIRYAESGKLWL